MIGRVSVELPTPTYIALLQQLRQSGSAADPALALTAAVEFWLAEQRRLTGAAPACARGYQWKSLFLPEGTELRSWSYAQHKFARVEGDQIIYDGRAVTPNQFACALACTPRIAALRSGPTATGDCAGYGAGQAGAATQYRCGSALGSSRASPLPLPSGRHHCRLAEHAHRIGVDRPGNRFDAGGADRRGPGQHREQGAVMGHMLDHLARPAGRQSRIGRQP